MSDLLGILFGSIIGVVSPMRKSRKEYVARLIVEDCETDGPMTADDATRALALLTRWALRKTQKRRQGVEEEVSRVVNGDFSKGSGPEEAAQLTCYGPTKR